MSSVINFELVRVLRKSGVAKRCALGKSTIDSLVKRNEFPQPIRLSARAVGWRVEDVDRWLSERHAATAAS
jgi:prophage regulatory protein